MWRSSRDRYANRRPYPTTRPIHFNTQHATNRQRDPFNLDPFARPSTPTPKPNIAPNLFNPFLFQPPFPSAHPNRVNPVPPPPPPPPPSAEPLASSPRLWAPPPSKFPRKDAPQTPTTPSPPLKYPSKMPGAFPMSNTEEPPTDPQPAETQAKDEEIQDYQHREASDIRQLEKRVQNELGGGELDAEEEMLLKQLNALHLNHNFRNNLFKSRLKMERAARNDKKRARMNAERDAAVEKMVRLEEEAEERERQREKMEQEKRERLYERQQKYREELRKREKEEEEARRKQEAEAWEQEQLRQAEELAKQRERERKEREARAREEAERRAAEDRRRMQENIRKAREHFSAETASAIRIHFGLYDEKWNELRTKTQFPPLCFSILPWPVLGTATSPSDITPERVQAFIFHPLRADAETKSRRERVRAEILKYHPDKFNGKVVGAVIDAEKELVKEGAGVVARILTQILEEETRKEQRGY